MALLKILCAQRFDIRPEFVTMPPDLPTMIGRCDAALMIGDVALFADPQTAGVQKIDCGDEWTAMTGLPFVYACWAGRNGALGSDDVKSLQNARDRGMSELDAIAGEYYGDDEAKKVVATQYLHGNVQYEVGEQELAGLYRFLETACALGNAPGPVRVDFY